MSFAFGVAVLWTMSMLALATPASAASLMNGGHPSVNCAMTLQGPITQGDLAKLQAPDVANRLLGFRTYLCLDSPGGSFPEAIEIADFLHENGMATAIPEGATCLSACAIAFLGGSQFSDSPDPIPHRLLHVGGRLGVHAPSLAVPDGNYTRANVIQSFDIAMRSASEIIDRSDRLRLTPDFIVDMLAVPGSEMMEIDTVAQAHRLALRVTGYRRPRLMTDEMVIAACRTDGHFDPAARIYEGGFSDARVLRGGDNRVGAYIHLNEVEGTPQWYACVVRYDPSKATSNEPRGTLRIYRSSTPALEQPRFADLMAIGANRFQSVLYSHITEWQMFPPSARLADLSALSAEIDRKGSSHAIESTRSANKARVCVVIASATMTETDREPCTVWTERDYLMGAEHTVALWPSGARTIVTRRGAQTRVNDRFAKDTDLAGHETCVLNHSSGNLFCLSQPN